MVAYFVYVCVAHGRKRLGYLLLGNWEEGASFKMGQFAFVVQIEKTCSE